MGATSLHGITEAPHSRGAFLTGVAASIAAIALPARAAAADVRYLWLTGGAVPAGVRAAFTIDGVTIYKPGYYRLCAAFADTSVNPQVGYVQIDPRLIDGLWEIQRYYRSIGIDAPLEIHSGFRTPAHNELVGGVSGSYHLVARAVDFTVRGVPARHTGRVARALPGSLIGGVGTYVDDDHVHVDTGPRDGRFWCGEDQHACRPDEL